MIELGLCENMPFVWNKQRILKVLRDWSRQLDSRAEAHIYLRGEVNKLILTWRNIEKAILLLKWYEELI